MASTATIFDPEPRIETDGVGKWVIVWDSRADLGGTIGSDVDILFVASVDDGASWTATAPVNTNAEEDSIDDGHPDIATDGSGNWYVAWHGSIGGAPSSSRDVDILIARSTDSAVTWTNPAALNANAARDKGRDLSPRLAYDGQGHGIAVWISDDDLGGTIGSDLDILVATSSDDCPLAPAAGCLTALKSNVDLRERVSGKDSFVWKWSKGEATTIADFDDPTAATTDYVACLYDDVSGSPRLELEMDMPGGALCKLKPKSCWKARTDGFRYKDRRLEHGAVKTLTLRAGADGKAAIKLRAKAPTLAPPRLPLSQSPTVTVQLHNLGNGSCWETAFSTARTNDAERFKAKAP